MKTAPGRNRGPSNEEEPSMSATASSSTGSPWTVVIIIVAVAAYFVPSIVAFARGTDNRWSVLVVDFFLAWSVIGWIVALAMAVSHARPSPPAPQP